MFVPSTELRLFMTIAIIILQDYPTDEGVLLKVDVEDIHQIENGDTSFRTEGCFYVIKKDLRTTYQTFTPIRFETIL